MIQGLVAEECRKAGRQAPVCQGIVDLARRIHAGEIEPGLDNLKLAGQ
jgi:hypothetical protein